MNLISGRGTGGKSKGISGGTFARVTFVAVIIAVVLITLGRISSSTAAVSILPPNSTTTILATLTPTPTFTGTAPSPLPTIIDTTKGSPNASITIIEYSDFQCAHCQEFALTLEKPLEAAYIDAGKVRLIYKFMVAYGPESERADEAAACAAEHGQFWPYYFLLMQQRASPSVDDLPVEKLQGLAQQLGLNMDTFNASFLSGKFAAWVSRDDAEGRAVGITGTPTFFINGVRMDGATSLGDFQKIIDPMLEKWGK